MDLEKRVNHLEEGQKKIHSDITTLSEAVSKLTEAVTTLKDSETTRMEKLHEITLEQQRHSVYFQSLIEFQEEAVKAIKENSKVSATLDNITQRLESMDRRVQIIETSGTSQCSTHNERLDGFKSDMSRLHQKVDMIVNDLNKDLETNCNHANEKIAGIRYDVNEIGNKLDKKMVEVGKEFNEVKSNHNTFEKEISSKETKVMTGFIILLIGILGAFLTPYFFGEYSNKTVNRPTIHIDKEYLEKIFNEGSNE